MRSLRVLLTESWEKEVEGVTAAQKVANREVSPAEILTAFERASVVCRIWLSVDDDVASRNRKG